MKRNSGGNDHNDVMRQRKYPMPGTDLAGGTTAIPFNQAEDVDAPGAFPWERDSVCECGHFGRHYGNECHGHHASKTFVVERERNETTMAPNPTRAKRNA